METIFSNIKERVLQLSELKGIAKEKFFADLGVSYGNFKGEAKKKALSSDVVATIVTTYDDVNAEWLLTGKGPIFKIPGDMPLMVAEAERAYNLSVNKQLKQIPLVNASAVAGFGNDHFAISERDIKEYYTVPKFRNRKVDFMIEVEGASMYPKLSSGDVVACTIINERGWIQWHKIHVVATRDQGILIKRLEPCKDENCLTMVSDNEKYKAFDVPKDQITGIALVVGVIRLE